MAVPKYDDLFNPLLKAIHELGGSASVIEIEEKVADLLNLSDGDINEIHRGNRTKLSYRLAWARNYLKRYGLLYNSTRGIWILTPKGQSVTTVNKQVVNKFVKTANNIEKKIEFHEEHTQDLDKWKDEALEIIKNILPPDFERLCQRILREAGFVQVRVTGKSGDGGIDGVGMIKIAGFLTFRVIFQCKRYQGSITSQQIREFKGTMVGRADKGLFITTGSFTRDAKDEASRDGSIPIDLVDGGELVEKMKELRLGVIVKSEEIIEIDKNWFESF
jgi:restriction system protein